MRSYTNLLLSLWFLTTASVETKTHYILTQIFVGSVVSCSKVHIAFHKSSDNLESHHNSKSNCGGWRLSNKHFNFLRPVPIRRESLPFPGMEIALRVKIEKRARLRCSKRHKIMMPPSSPWPLLPNILWENKTCPKHFRGGLLLLLLLISDEIIN